MRFKVSKFRNKFEINFFFDTKKKNQMDKESFRNSVNFYNFTEGATTTKICLKKLFK